MKVVDDRSTSRFGAKTKTLVCLRDSIKEEQRRVKSRRFELRNNPSLELSHSLLLSCTNTARSVCRQVFSAGCRAAGGTRSGVSFPPPSLSPATEHEWDSVVSSSMCMIIIKKNDLTAHSSTSSVGRAALTDISRFTKRSRSLMADGERSLLRT